MGVFRRDAGDNNNTSHPVAEGYSTIRPMTAAATLIKSTDKNELELFKERKTSQNWQNEAWDYLDLIGEIKYALALFSNSLARIRIHGAYLEDDHSIPNPINASTASDETKEAVTHAMNRVFGGGKQSNLLRKAGLNLLCVGECYLVQEKQSVTSSVPETWKIVSNDQLVPIQGKGFGLKTRKNQRPSDTEPLHPQAFIARIWKEHPRYSDEADSSMRPLLELCGELLLLDRTVRSSARSRLNAGALLIPDTLAVSQEVATDDIDDDLDPYEEDETDEFEEQLIDGIVAPISDETSAAAAVPTIIRGTAEALKEVRLIKFERAFDAALSVERDRALERILQGLDLPKEIVTGVSSLKYANSVQVTESLYTQHIEPLILMICDAFRTVYLVPSLEAAGVPDDEIEKCVIWYDPSGITAAPDKSAAANIGFDKMTLSGVAWRRANGFTEEDAPTDLEIAQRMAMSRGQLNDKITEQLLETIMPDILKKTRETTLAESPAPIPDDVQETLDGAEAPPVDPTDPNAETPADDSAPEGEEPTPPPNLMQ